MKVFPTGAISAACLLLGCGHQTQDKIYEGHYNFGSEIQAFTPCGEEKDYWIVADEKVWIALRDAWLELAVEPTNDLYVKVSGAPAGTPSEGKSGYFSLEFDALFKISKVWMTRPKSESDCSAIR